jgi:lysine-N-methylase
MARSRCEVLAPEYTFRFSCIGPECEDTCCRGWRVHIDKDTYRKYRRIRHPELRSILDKACTRNRSNPTSKTYAKLNMNQNGMCPLLSPEGWCRIHAELGAEYLSHVCWVYPRIIHEVDQVLECFLTFSCPEATRLALLDPKPMEFVQVPELGNDRSVPRQRVDTVDVRLARRLESYFWPLRHFVISLLQARSYTVWERLVILGLFMQKLESLQDEGFRSVPGLIEQYCGTVPGGALRESLASVPVQETIQAKLARELVSERLRQSVSNKTYVQCLVETLVGLGVTGNTTDEAIGERYREAYQDHYSAYMSEREYILEHYLVNHVFKNLFPLGGRGPFGEYVMLVIHYALIKMHLIGMAAFHKGLTDELVIRLIYSFSRVIEHNPIYLNRIFRLLSQSGLNNMAYMAILIRN